MNTFKNVAMNIMKMKQLTATATATATTTTNDYNLKDDHQEQETIVDIEQQQNKTSNNNNQFINTTPPFETNTNNNNNNNNQSRKEAVDEKEEEKDEIPDTLLGKANNLLRFGEQLVAVAEGSGDDADGDAKNVEKQLLLQQSPPPPSNSSKCAYYYCRPCSIFFNFVTIRMKSLTRFMYLFTVVQILLIGMAAVLYYAFHNPIVEESSGVSYSWYLLLMARFLITFTLALAAEILLIDYLILETKLSIWSIGRFLTLMTAQAKGWPIRIMFWGVFNFALLYGDHNYVQNSWINWPEFVSQSHSGTLLSSHEYRNILLCLIIVGGSVMVKRALIVALTGKKKFGMFKKYRSLLLLLCFVFALSLMRKYK